MATTGERIRMLREEAGMKQSDLCKMLGVSEQTISDYEKNRTQPSIEKLRIMAGLFDTTLDYIGGHSDERRTVEQQLADVTGEAHDIRQILTAAIQRKDLRLIYGALKDIPPDDLRTLVRILSTINKRDN